MRRLALATAAVVLAVGVVIGAVPYLTGEREATSAVPTPPPLDRITRVTLRPDDVVCMQSVAVAPESRVARFITTRFREPGPPLRLRFAGAGYRSVAEVPGGYAAKSLVAVPFEPPRRSTLATACLRNVGRRPVTIVGTAEARTESRSTATLNGRPIPARVSMTLLEGETGSVLDRLGTLFDHAAAFRPGVLGAWVYWPLALLVVFAAPAAILWALGDAFRDEEPSQPPPRDASARS